MEAFQRTVLIIAIILLLVSLIFIGMSLNSAKASSSWPPILTKCPDYWEDVSEKGDGSACTLSTRAISQGLTTTCPSSNVDFTKAPYIGNGGSCAKKKWANGCGVTWDGITSGVKDPCSLRTSPTGP